MKGNTKVALTFFSPAVVVSKNNEWVLQVQMINEGIT